MWVSHHPLSSPHIPPGQDDLLARRILSRTNRRKTQLSRYGWPHAVMGIPKIMVSVINFQIHFRPRKWTRL